MRFRAELKTNGKTAAGFEVPDQIVADLGGGGRPKVKVTIGGYEFRTSIARMGERYLLGVSNERRAEAGIAAGDTLDVEVELDTAERRVEIPVDLAEALAAGAGGQGVLRVAVLFQAAVAHPAGVLGEEAGDPGPSGGDVGGDARGGTRALTSAAQGR